MLDDTHNLSDQDMNIEYRSIATSDCKYGDEDNKTSRINSIQYVMTEVFEDQDEEEEAKFVNY